MPGISWGINTFRTARDGFAPMSLSLIHILETYRAFAGQITFGPTKEAEATKTAEASDMPEAGESAAGTSEASKAPEESKKPDPTKTKAPEATPTKQAPEPTKNQGGVVDEG